MCIPCLTDSHFIVPNVSQGVVDGMVVEGMVGLAVAVAQVIAMLPCALPPCTLSHPAMGMEVCQSRIFT